MGKSICSRFPILSCKYQQGFLAVLFCDPSSYPFRMKLSQPQVWVYVTKGSNSHQPRVATISAKFNPKAHSSCRNMTFKQPSWLNCCTEGNYVNRSLTGFRRVAAVDVTIGVEKRIANLVFLGTETYLHFEMGYEVNGTKLHNINKKFAAAEI